MALPAPLRAAWAAKRDDDASERLTRPDDLRVRLRGELRAAAARAAAAAEAEATAAARGGPRAMAPPPRAPMLVRAPRHTNAKR